MKKVTRFALYAFLAVASVACNNDDDEVPPVTNTTDATILQGAITSDMKLTADKKYLLKGTVYVIAPAKLTIEPGTIIKGDKSTKASLVIERGAQIIAEGTAEKPIVFTSNQPKGQRKAGDWGGLIILGNAPQNLPGSPAIEGGIDRLYGGSETADNSGILKYVRIEFPGIAFQPNNEINGLTMGGVGSGTTIDYVQVSYSGDDAFEWFGGTVNAKHLIAYKPVDDMFDTDNGYSGNIQFALGMSDPNVADVSKSNGFESDNDSNGSSASPQTSAVFSNVSLYGPYGTANQTGVNDQFGRGMHIRRNNAIDVHNSLIAGWPVGLLFDGTATLDNADNGSLIFKNNVVAGTKDQSKSVTISGAATNTNFNIQNWFDNNGNMVKATNAELGISGAFNQTSPKVLPDAGSDLLNGANFTNLAGFENVAYRGAFGTQDWTAGWANFDPQNTDY